jgi:AmiR/NasT family two-component response regulator
MNPKSANHAMQSKTSPAGKTAARAGSYPEQPRTILIADDEHLVASGLAASLRELGYTVIGPAADGEEAVGLCSSVKPDMALLDIRMPKRNGLDAAEVIFRQMHIPVVIFSAYSDKEYIDSSNEVGVFGYLLKPVTQDQLRVGISVAWGRFLDHISQSTEISHLKQRLESRKIVEQAKWVLVQKKNISEPDAMRLLQRQARNNRRTLVDVAKSLLENEELFNNK